MNLNGLLYFPSTSVGFDGNQSTTCSLLISKQLVIDGDSNFDISGCTNAGLTRLPMVYTVAVAE